MTEIEDFTNTMNNREVEDLIDIFNYNLKKKIRVEFWSEEGFRSYFEGANKLIINPITGIEHYPNGLYTYMKKEKTHGLAIVVNDVWKKTLFHELMHCFQHELIGRRWWIKLKRFYKEMRMLDPFEIQAELYAINKIEAINKKN